MNKSKNEWLPVTAHNMPKDKQNVLFLFRRKTNNEFDVDKKYTDEDFEIDNILSEYEDEDIRFGVFDEDTECFMNVNDGDYYHRTLIFAWRPVTI